MSEYIGYVLGITGLVSFLGFLALILWDDYVWQRDMPKRIRSRLEMIQEKRGE